MSPSEPSPDLPAPAAAGTSTVESPPTAQASVAPPRTARRTPSHSLALVSMLAAGMVLFVLRLEAARERRPGDLSELQGFVEASVDLDQHDPSVAPVRGRRRAGRDRRRGGVIVVAESPLEQFLQGAARAVRLAGQREQRLAVQPLDLQAVGVAREAALCAGPLHQLLRSPQPVEAQAERYEELGRPAFLCAVAELAEFDYEAATDCRLATRVLQVLGRFVGSARLEVTTSGGAPSESETCRYLATAEAWRQLAERFAYDDPSYAAMREAAGKGEAAVAEGPR